MFSKKSMFILLLVIPVIWGCNNSLGHDDHDDHEHGIDYELNVVNGLIISLGSASNIIDDEYIINDLNAFYQKNGFTAENGEIVHLEAESANRGTCSAGGNCSCPLYSEEVRTHYHPWPFKCRIWKKIYKCSKCGKKYSFTSHKK